MLFILILMPGRRWAINAGLFPTVMKPKRCCTTPSGEWSRDGCCNNLLGLHVPACTMRPVLAISSWVNCSSIMVPPPMHRPRSRELPCIWLFTGDARVVALQNICYRVTPLYHLRPEWYVFHAIMIHANHRLPALAFLPAVSVIVIKDEWPSPPASVFCNASPGHHYPGSGGRIWQ